MSHWVDKDTLVDESGKPIIKGRAISASTVDASGALTAASVAASGAVSGTTMSGTAISASVSSEIDGAHGEKWIKGQNTELITIAAGATSTSVADLLPANSVIEAVVVRVTVAIPTATTFSVGDGTTAARFGSGIAVDVDTVNVGIGHHNTANTNAQGPVQSAAAKIVITPNGTPAAATGRLRVTVFYRQFVAPTS